MKKIAFILSRLLLLLAVAATTLPATAYDFMTGGIAYNINADGSTVTVTYERSYDNYGYTYPTASGSLTIPSTVTHSGKTYSVTSIGDAAFAGCSGFTGSLTIPNSVTSIGYSAFSGCSGFNGSLNIPNSVTSIASYAFDGCSGFSGSLNIGNSVSSIGERAFEYCSGFTGSLTIGNSVTSIGESAFGGCRGFTGSLTIGNSVTSIGEYAFSGCSGFTGSLTIPNSVTAIGNSAFSGCSGFTGSLNIPNSVTTIGYRAFANCTGFESLKVAPGNPKYDSRDNCNAVIETATNTLVCGIKSFSIPNSVTAIAPYAFSGCSGFTGSLNIPNSVTSIGEAAFIGCRGFTSVNIPNSVTEIGQSSFSGCSGLTQLELGSGLKDIGAFAFSGCPLAHIICHRDRPAAVANENAFSCYSTATVHVPKGSLQSYYAAPVWMKFDNYTDDAAVEEAVRGDLNGDGVVDIDDLNVLVNIMLNKE